MLAKTAASALINLVLFVVIPFLGYFLYHRRRNGSSMTDVARRVGLTIGLPRYIGYCLAVSAIVVAALAIWPPPLAPFIREGSAQRPFAGAGLGLATVASALLYGAVQTGFSEEFLFRGMIAGSLSRRLSRLWANLLQATIFLAPHLLLLVFMPEMWGVMPIIFAGALFAGWARIASGSIVGPWILHASVNVNMALSVAIRSS